MKTGSNYLGDGRSEFIVWAPRADELFLKVSPGADEKWRVFPMEQIEAGYWRATAEAGPGARYYFLVNGQERPDPASHFQPSGVHGPSEVVDHGSFKWSDHGWENVHPATMVIYEIHAGVFTEAGRLDSITERLDELRDLGVNAIELMPVAQFPGERNWGYDGVFPFAVQNTYGGPMALKKLVNECHVRGIAVLLDVVYNHFGPEGNYTEEFGPYSTDQYLSPWGRAMNFDGPESDHVREFFISNALHWFERYHIDGLRCDAVHAIIDNSALPFLKALRRRVSEYAISRCRPFYLFAETDLNDTKIICTGEYSYGLDAGWCDDFHHALHALLTGERDGYYVDFGAVWQMVKALNEGYIYSGQYSKYRKRSFGSRSGHIPKERFIVFVQNHDQIGNRMLGERLSALAGFEGQKLAAGMLLLSPYVPLIFMGEEYGEQAPFLYFVSHADGQLLESVRNGRKKEFSEFQWRQEPPPPDAPETFEASRLRWEKRLEGRGAVLLNLYRTLIKIRRAVPALSPLESRVSAWGVETDKTVFMAKDRGASSVFAAFNFNGSDVNINFPEGRWVKAIDSADEAWEGPGSGLPGVAHQQAVALMKALSFALFVKED